jgi:hypothetical protein
MNEPASLPSSEPYYSQSMLSGHLPIYIEAGDLLDDCDSASLASPAVDGFVVPPALGLDLTRTERTQQTC